MVLNRVVVVLRQQRRVVVAAAARFASAQVEAPPPHVDHHRVAEQGHRLAVKAFYVARSIDVVQLYEKSSRGGFLKQHRFGRESVMLSFLEESEAVRYYDLDEPEPREERDLEPSRGHVVVFSYGSVVFFNVDPATQHDCLTSFAPFCIEAIPDGFQPTEDYCVVSNDEASPASPDASRLVAHRPRPIAPREVAATLSRAAATRREPATTLSSVAAKSVRRRHVATPTTEIRFDAVVLPRLDVHNLSVIATVMAQSVALDHYSVKVDAMLETFTRLNSSVEKTGVFSALEKQNLFRLVALNNTLFTEIISKIGLLERSETAWKNVEYTQIWEGLRDEFEVEDRFDKIEFKLNLVQLNTKFFLEVLNNQKSNTLEWIIIVLITLEILVSCADLANVRPFG